MTWLTADLPGTGGHYKVSPEDFFVEELPLYPCSGQGEHLFIQIEKSGRTTHEVLRQLARLLRIPEREIGYAGLKDARAVTRQWLSLPAKTEAILAALQNLPCTILQSNRHGNKLRLGHLAGNRFRLRIRQPAADALPGARAILARLTAAGVPNRFGEQRYGSLGNSHILGRLLLQQDYPAFCRELLGDPQQIEDPAWQKASLLFRSGDLPAAAAALPQRMPDEANLIRRLASGKSPREAVLAMPKRLLRLYLSALQSSLFDQLLEARMPELQLLQPGDLAFKHANGACFLVEDPQREQPRADNFEISPTAPLFGTKVRLAQGVPGQAESDLLTENGLESASWKLGSGLTLQGDRRALRVPLGAAEVTPLGGDLQLDFCLPRGSYATSVLYEVIK